MNLLQNRLYSSVVQRTIILMHIRHSYKEPIHKLKRLYSKEVGRARNASVGC